MRPRLRFVLPFAAIVSACAPAKAPPQPAAVATPSDPNSPDRVLSKKARELYEGAKALSGDERRQRLAEAERTCREYLNLYPETRNAYPIRMMLGETLYLLGQVGKDKSVRVQKFQEALETYLVVAKADDGTGEAEFRALAAENAILAAEDVVKLVGPSRRPGAKETPPVELPLPERDVERACLEYVRVVPKARHAAVARYKAAHLQLEFLRFDEATTGFDALVEAHPSTVQARFAADMLFALVERRSGVGAVNELAKRFLGIPALADQVGNDGVAYRSTLERAEEKSAYRLIEQRVANGEHGAAAAAFEKFSKTRPTSDLADDALYSAAVEFGAAKAGAERIRVLEEFLVRFPNDTRIADVRRILKRGP